MPALYITEQGAKICKRGHRIVVIKNEQILMDVPAFKIDTIMIYGNVQFTTQAACQFMAAGIELAFFNMDRQLKGQITPPKAKNIELRIGQFRKFEDPQFRLKMARAFVAGKLGNSLQFIRDFRYNHPGIDLSTEEARIGSGLKMCEQVTELPALMGVEGTAANAHFQALAKMVPVEFRFSGRTRRPPKDPVNALLSFGYMLVTTRLQALLDGMGFDPYLGFFHQFQHGKPSLALDLIEEFRPALIDRLVVRLLNRKMITTGDFMSARRSEYRLSQDGLKKFLNRFDSFINSTVSERMSAENLNFIQYFRRQSRRLAQSILNDEFYTAVRI